MLYSTLLVSSISTAVLGASLPQRVPRQDTEPTCAGKETGATFSYGDFDVVCDQDYAGGDLKYVGTASFGECLAACDAEPNSACVTLAYVNGACYLKNKVTPAVSNVGVWSAKRNVIPTDNSLSCVDNKSDGATYTAGGKDFKIICGREYFGGDLASTSTSTFEGCIDACAANAQCIDVSYVNGACYLKQTVSTLVDAGSVWTAQQLNVQPAPVPSPTPAQPSASPSPAGPTPLTCQGNADNGKSYTSMSGKGFTIECGIDHAGGDFKSLGSTTFETCMDACAAEDSCVDVSFVYGSCYLKNVLNEGVVVDYVWTGRLSQAPAQSPSATPVASSSVVEEPTPTPSSSVVEITPSPSSSVVEITPSPSSSVVEITPSPSSSVVEEPTPSPSSSVVEEPTPSPSSSVVEPPPTPSSSVVEVPTPTPSSSVVVEVPTPSASPSEIMTPTPAASSSAVVTPPVVPSSPAATPTPSPSPSAVVTPPVVPSSPAAVTPTPIATPTPTPTPSSPALAPGALFCLKLTTPGFRTSGRYAGIFAGQVNFQVGAGTGANRILTSLFKLNSAGRLSLDNGNVVTLQTANTQRTNIRSVESFRADLQPTTYPPVVCSIKADQTLDCTAKTGSFTLNNFSSTNDIENNLVQLAVPRGQQNGIPQAIFYSFTVVPRASCPATS